MEVMVHVLIILKMMKTIHKVLPKWANKINRVQRDVSFLCLDLVPNMPRNML